MKVKVFKFGGASVKDADGFRNVGSILKRYSDEKIVVVISAMGKMTNALEKVVQESFVDKERAIELLEAVKDDHFEVISELFDGRFLEESELISEMDMFFDQATTWLGEKASDGFDFAYDQIVSVGELASSLILNHYLVSVNLASVMTDIRKIIMTDNTYRDAKIAWEPTKEKASKTFSSLFEHYNLVVTQGFLGFSDGGFTTTLGREGSDYTAAILSYCLDAESMHIWKDVPGVLTGDPRLFEDVTLLRRLSYTEAIEMTYYGAKVIHPKTIKPLENKQIPLYVRPFGDAESEGTLISDLRELSYPPVVVIEPDQALLHISVKDFSFVAEHHLSSIFQLMARYRLKVNMMRNTAISFSVCVNNIPERIDKFKSELEREFKITVDSGLELITILHYDEDTLQEMKRGKLIVFEEKLPEAVQVVARVLPKMKRKE